LSRCKICRELNETRQIMFNSHATLTQNGQTQVTQQHQSQTDEDIAGISRILRCTACNENKELSFFLDGITNSVSDICTACSTVQQEGEITEMDGGLRPFGELDNTLYCFECNRHCLVSSFPAGVGPGDVACCNDCQERLDHMPIH
jgi:hypothetical protein